MLLEYQTRAGTIPESPFVFLEFKILCAISEIPEMRGTDTSSKFSVIVCRRVSLYDVPFVFLHKWVCTKRLH